MPEVKEEVTVSATRTDRRLQDEPLRVEVIDREEIEEKALMTPGSVAMLLGETTGLRVQTVAPSLGAANVRIQGLRGRYAQLLADGLPLYGAGGDSLNLLQVPPLDLGQVEVIKGAASALYGPAALGGIINLVSRRPQEAETEALVNVTSQAGLDGTFWTASAPVDGRSWTLLSGFHGQRRQDLDDDGWSDLPAFARAVVRPRFRLESDTGAALFVTGGAIVEQRDGGTEPGALAPDGAPFAQDLDTFRADAGAVGRWVSGRRLFAARGAYSRNGQRRTFGDVVERGARHTAFGEATMTMPAGRHTLVVGAALQQDRFDSRDLPRFDYVFTVPAVFAQDRDHAGLAARDLRQRARRRAQRVRHAGEPARLGAAQAVRGVDGAPVDRRRGVRADPVHRGDRRQRTLAAGAARRAGGGAGPHGIGRRDVDARPVRDQRHPLRIERRRRRAARDAGAGAPSSARPPIPSAWSTRRSRSAPGGPSSSSATGAAGSG